MFIDIKLLQEIEKRPCLYNVYLPEYNRKDELESAWIDVSTECNLTINEAKDKWKNIRSSFVRSLKLLEHKKTKKAYYLSPYLQFVIPFLKIDKNDTSLSQHTNKTDASSSYALLDDKLETEDLQSDDNFNELPVTIKIEPDFNIDDDTDVLDANYYETQDATVEESNSKNQRALVKRKITSDRDQHCFKAAKSRHDSVSTSKSENMSMRYFMMSLLPEFDTMTEDQIRTFKVKTLMTIDEIKNGSSKIEHSNSDRLQKRLINLLLKSLEKKS